MSEDIVKKLKGLVSKDAWLTNREDMHGYITEWRDSLIGNPMIVLFPDSTKEVSLIMKFCAKNNIQVVPQGGNTGLCGGAIPDDTGTQVIISLERLNKIRKISIEDQVIELEAGCLLTNVQEEVAKNDFIFPIDMASSGSCQIGGNISTNAGGTNVLKYGSTRSQILGLEVVLPNGSIWNGISSLIKDNSGYDIKQLFIGAEGTLGIITAASIKLYPVPGEIITLFIGVNYGEAIQFILKNIRKKYKNNIETFELISERALNFVTDFLPNIKPPLMKSYEYYLLIELSDSSLDQISSHLMSITNFGFIEDVVIAKNKAEQDSLWLIRDSISAAQKHHGLSLKHDISVPIGDAISFINYAEREVLNFLPSSRIVAFGHLGDGNIHFNVSQPLSMTAEEFKHFKKDINKIVYECAIEFGGSICAEHGVGILKKEDMLSYKSTIEINLMKALKTSIDPKNIMNPGKIF